MSAMFTGGGGRYAGSRQCSLMRDSKHNGSTTRKEEQVEELPSTESYWSNQELSNLQQQKLVVEQLRREASVKPLPVSEAVEEIKQFINNHEQEDYLLIGFTSQKANPFREKSSCDII